MNFKPFVKACFYLVAFVVASDFHAAAQQGPTDDGIDCDTVVQGSPYIPVDSWVYPAVYRLYTLGYVESPYLNLRPWTRRSLSNMLRDTQDMLADADPSPGEDEAEGIFDALKHELRDEMSNQCDVTKGTAKFESTYTAVRGIGGTPLRDSFHFGSTIVNDFGRPYAGGLNSYSGVSGYASARRFVLYARPELQYAPSATGYSQTLAACEYRRYNLLLHSHLLGDWHFLHADPLQQAVNNTCRAPSDSCKNAVS